MRIAILGAPGSGKTRLACELQRHLPDLHVNDDPPLTDLQTNDFDLILLMGLDLPSGDTAHEADARLRATLQQGDITYSVVYGRGPQRLHNTLRLIVPQDTPQARWNGVCERCADPDCEYRLFTGLRDLKAAAHPRP